MAPMCVTLSIFKWDKDRWRFDIGASQWSVSFHYGRQTNSPLLFKVLLLYSLHNYNDNATCLSASGTAIPVSLMSPRGLRYKSFSHGCCHHQRWLVYMRAIFDNDISLVKVTGIAVPEDSSVGDVLYLLNGITAVHVWNVPTLQLRQVENIAMLQWERQDIIFVMD